VAGVGAPGFSETDTPAVVQARIDEVWRRMSFRERFDLVAGLNDSCEQLAAAGVRARYPAATDEEVRRRVLALRLGRDLMVRVYGWDPHVEGW
jgi:hypothetical protein